MPVWLYLCQRFRRYAGDRGIFRNWLQYNGVGANFGVATDFNISMIFAPAPIITPSRTFGWRSPLFPVPPRVTLCKIENVVFDNRGFADNNTGRMVKHNTIANAPQDEYPHQRQRKFDFVTARQGTCVFVAIKNG